MAMSRQEHHGITMSANYLGSHDIAANWPEDIPEEENTSIWLTGLHPKTDYHALLGAIRHAGAIKASHINHPQDGFSTCAAKVVFFTRAGAERVYISAKLGDFTVMGVRPRVEWNRVRTSEELHRELRTRGTFMWWDVDSVLDVGEVLDGDCVVWYRFGSWRCQASRAKEALEARYPNDVEVTYQPDPCA
ncbi:hypothetical protein F4810DRAFT_722327 [Camillea tinctor]|nr:hypothetical protein F4810DRAFT_722327 [Camillea tinctor]